MGKVTSRVPRIFLVFAFLLGSFRISAASIDRQSLNGDIRYRHQITKSKSSPNRFRDRLRLRLGTKFELDQEIGAHVRLASGESDDNALSTNQSLGDGGSKKPFWIDHAFLKWRPSDQWDLRLGKIKNLWWEPDDLQLQFDEDYTPEGLAGEWRGSGLSRYFFASFHGHWLKERRTAAAPETSTDVGTLGAQVGGFWALHHHQVTLAWGYLSFPNLRGSTAINNDDDFSGNTFVRVGSRDVYAHDFDILSLAGEWVYGGGLRQPIKLDFSATQNLRLSRQHRSAATGVAFGGVEQKGDWEVGYRFRYNEADSLMAGLSDSDVGQATDARGHVASVKYGLTDQVTLAATYYRYKVDLSSNLEEWQRVHLDLSAKF